MTKKDLKTMQGWSLERKIRVTQTRIIEWYQHFNGQVYVSFSGGKDSTVLLDLARRIYPDIPAVFVDTGLEYPSIREFVKTKENMTWLRPEMSFKEVIETYGYPVISKEVSDAVSLAKRGYKCGIQKLNGLNADGTESSFRQQYKKYKYLLNAPFMIGDECCMEMKKKPVKKYEKESGRNPIIGTMASESAVRQTSWLRTGCNAFNSERPISTPIAFWTEQDILAYLKQFSIPYADVYGDIVEENNRLKTTGLSRTGCMFCMFGVHLEKEPNRFQRMKEQYPKIYDYCIRPVEENGLGLGKVLDYIGVKYE